MDMDSHQHRRHDDQLAAAVEPQSAPASASESHSIPHPLEDARREDGTGRNPDTTAAAAGPHGEGDTATTGSPSPARDNDADDAVRTTDTPGHATGSGNSHPNGTPHAAAAAADGDGDGDATTAALIVRSNMLRGMWNGYRALGRGRRGILIVRLLVALAQIIPAIAILALPTSLGNSRARESDEVCDPEPIFVFLALHTVRVAASLPLDLYLSLSPHRNARQRRLGSSGFADRERRRQFGSIPLDRKASRLADLLGFCHVVLFAVGNYVVWSGTECSSSPADSVPLFWTSVAMLAVSYIVIVNVVLLIFLVVFCLPLLLAIMRALGLQHRIPTPRIRPETGKVEQSEVDKVTKLVYYLPIEEDSEGEANVNANADGSTAAAEAETAPTTAATPSPAAPLPESSLHPSPSPSSHRRPPLTTRLLGRLLGVPQRSSPDGSNAHKTSSSSTPASPSTADLATAAAPTTTTTTTSQSAGIAAASSGLKYPLHPIPAHRATCPICLCDFESPVGAAGAAGAANSENTDSATPPSPSEPEPLRLLPCNHVLHKSCVDEWLVTVSGRCPVCQKPILDEAGDAAEAA